MSTSQEIVQSGLRAIPPLSSFKPPSLDTAEANAVDMSMRPDGAGPAWAEVIRDREATRMEMTATPRPDGTLPRPPMRNGRPRRTKETGFVPHPNSLATLERVRHMGFFGNAKYACKACNDRAVRGMKVCRRHGGAVRARERNYRLQHHYYSKPAAVRRLARDILVRGLAPLDLLQNNTFRTVAAIALDTQDELWRLRRLRYRGDAGADFEREAYLMRKSSRALETVWAMTNAWIIAAETDTFDAWRDAIAMAERNGLLAG